ncbi:MAG TPA: zf-HC2 domain-containing protein [Thermoanaerobaculia bacterium]|nr:zf-HC2 domain-containing protein [Thermoanaerobaculia bacterium]
MGGDRIVAGLHCGEVLADLTEYLDGRLHSERMRRLQEHVKGCDLCARFGSELAVAVQALREGLQKPSRQEAVEARLLDRLRAELSHGE